MIKRITIPYFPLGIKHTTPLIFGGAIYLLVIGHLIWFGVLAFTAAAIWTSEYVTEVDLDKKECRDFLSIITIPFDDEMVKFSTINKIVITKDNHSQRLNSRSRSRQLDWSSFTGTLILDENKTIDLLTRNDKKDLIKGLKEFAGSLKVDIEDQTTSQHYVVDIAKI